MTVDEFEKALGKQFEGIELGLDKKAIPTIKDTESSITPASATSDIQLESGPTTETNIFDPIDPQDKGKEKEYQFNLNLGGSDKDKTTTTPAEKVEQITSYTNKETGKTTVDDPDTPENEAMLAQLGLLSTLRENQANPNVSRDPTSVNAAEAAYLQEALGNMDDPNFAEQVINKIIRNLTLGTFDPDDPQKRADANAILEAYKQTGKFVYDSEGNAIDLSKPYDTPEGKAAFDKLLGLSKGDGIEPAVIGVGDLEGNTVGFDDGTGFRNTAEGTQNILTGSFDVFGGGDTTTNITTGGGDDDDDDTTDDDTNYTTDKDGNIVCNTEGYIYNIV